MFPFLIILQNSLLTGYVMGFFTHTCKSENALDNEIM